MTAGESHIFDSFALLKFFQQERGHEKIVQLLKRIGRRGAKKYLNAINLGEIIYITKREFGDQKKIEVLAAIERLGFILLPATNDLILRAAEFKADFSISYADCFILASAVAHGAVIVTSDPEFKKVEHLAKVIWV